MRRRPGAQEAEAGRRDSARPPPVVEAAPGGRIRPACHGYTPSAGPSWPNKRASRRNWGSGWALTSTTGRRRQKRQNLGVTAGLGIEMPALGMARNGAAPQPWRQLVARFPPQSPLPMAWPASIVTRSALQVASGCSGAQSG